MNRLSRLKKPTHTITQDEWDQIVSESEAALELLNSPKFAFLRDYLTNAQLSIEKTFARQSINDVAIEDNTVVNGVVERVKRFFIPAKKEYTHLAGEYKFIERFLSDMSKFAELHEEGKKQRDQGILEITDV